MKVAKILTSKTGATLNDDATFTFPNALPGRGQCAEFVNDTLGLRPPDHMEDTLASKMNGVDFVTVKMGGQPTNGGYFVMDVQTVAGHTGLVQECVYDSADTLLGIKIVHYNWRGGEERNEEYITVGSPKWKKIVGFGRGNPEMDYPSTNAEFLKFIVALQKQINGLSPDQAVKYRSHKSANAARQLQANLHLPVSQ